MTAFIYDFLPPLSSLRGAKRRGNPAFRHPPLWIASLSLAMTQTD
tara:strand:+ start:1600 stop:1734 length:135 start_codon:yes stop_codon:yes gene_type:complete